MKKLLKRTALVISALLLLITVSWIGLAIFITYNKEYLRQKLVEIIEERTHAKVQINEVSSSILKTFPFMSMEISGISIRDSLYSKHHHDLFQADQVLLRASPASLITRKRIGKIIIRSGSLYLFTDSSGYSNKYIIQQKSASKSQKNSSIPDLRLESFQIEVSNQQLNKHYKGLARKIDCHIDDEENGSKDIQLKTDIQITGIGFNTRNGYFIENTSVRSDMRVFYTASNESLHFKNLVLKINSQPVSFTGLFDLGKTTNDFSLDIKAPNADYSELVKFLPRRTRKILSRYKISAPVQLGVTVVGKTTRNYEPHVTARMVAKKNDVEVPELNLTDCSFNAVYDNRMDSTQAVSDTNSIITFTDIKARYAGIPVSAKKTTFTNLIVTYMKSDLHADFPLAALNKELQSTTLRFNDGRAIIHANFEGPIAGTDSSSSGVDGYIRFINGGVTYLPRAITVNNLDGDLLFKHKDLVVPGITMNTGKSNLRVEGKAENFLSIFNISPEKLLLSWNVSSKELFLEDYKSFLAKRGDEKNAAKSRTALSKASNKIDKMFTDGNVHLSLSTPTLHYRKFDATDVRAAILLSNDFVDLENVSLRHADGTVTLKARMTQGGELNKVKLAAALNQINVPRIFNAFSNFGQDAITSSNLRGKLTASIDLDTYLTDAAKMKPDLTTGTIKFLLQDGELHDFEPVKKISEKALKKQDFTDIRFADLENKLEIKGTAFIVNRMEIRSTAITMFVEGIYDTKNGTDMSIQLPVRNLLKSNADTDLTEAGKDNKGISVRLRAHTGEDGKLQIGWDPFKKAVKNKQAMADKP